MQHLNELQPEQQSPLTPEQAEAQPPVPAPSKQLFQQKPRSTSGNAKPTASTATNILKPTTGYTSTAKASSLTGTHSPSHAKMRLNKRATRSRSPSRKTHNLLPAADSTSTATELVSKRRREQTWKSRSVLIARIGSIK